MPKPIETGSNCNFPVFYQPQRAPLVATLLICRFCGQITKKGDPLPGSKTPGQKKPQ